MSDEMRQDSIVDLAESNTLEEPKGTVDYNQLEEQVNSKLAKIAGYETDEEDVGDGNPEPEDREGTAHKDTDEDSEPSTKQKTANAEDSDDSSGDEPTIFDAVDVPEPMIRAAIDSGMSEQEVIDWWEGDAEGARKGMLELYNHKVDLLNAQSNMASHRPQPAETPPAANPPTPRLDTPDSPSMLDLAALREKYADDEDIITDVVEPLNKLLGQLSTKVAKLEEQQTTVSKQVEEERSRANAQQREVIGQQIDGFFNSPHLAPMREYYGSGAELDDAQLENRQRVVEFAGRLRAGALVRGEELSVEEALSSAHLALSAPYVKQALIAQIKNTATKRSKNSSLEPRKTTGAQEKDDRDRAKERVSEHDLEKRVTRQLQKIGALPR